MDLLERKGLEMEEEQKRKGETRQLALAKMIVAKMRNKNFTEEEKTIYFEHYLKVPQDKHLI